MIHVTINSHWNPIFSAKVVLLYWASHSTPSVEDASRLGQTPNRLFQDLISSVPDRYLLLIKQTIIETDLNRTDWRENWKHKILLLAFRFCMIWALPVSQTPSELLFLTPAVPSVWSTVSPNTWPRYLLWSLFQCLFSWHLPEPLHVVKRLVILPLNAYIFHL